MIAVGRPGIEKELGLDDASTCSATSTCFQVGNPSRAMIGSDAGTLYGVSSSSSGLPLAGCYLFLHRDSAGWHYDNGRCITAVEQIPSAIDQVYATSGCVDVLDTPSSSGQVVDCLPAHSRVDVDSAPTYATGHIWWHLACLGWMEHDFLVLPQGQTSAPGFGLPLQCQPPAPPYVPMVSLSLDAGTKDSSVVVVGSGFPPNEFATYYWLSKYPRVLGTPGDPPDAQGHFEFDTQDHGQPVGLAFYLPASDDQLCAEVEPQEPDKGKACAVYRVLGAKATPSPAEPTVSPSSPLSAIPSATPAGSVDTPLPAIQIGIGVLGAIFIGGSGLLWWRRRRRT